MPLFSLLRPLTTLLSLAILVGAGYLLWTWSEGEVLRDAGGALYRDREAWRLWTGVGLLAWSVLGRSVMILALARPDKRRSSAKHGQGEQVTAPSGSSLFVEVHGPAEAPLIIFTHGWGMDSTFWSYAKADLGDRFRLILWDLPGLGKSKARSADAISLDTFAADLSALLDRAGGKRPILVGHSIGGMTIQTLIRDNPAIQSRLAGVVLLNTTYTNPLKTMILSGLALALRRPVLEPVMKLVMVAQPLFWLMQWHSYLSGSAHLTQRIGFGKFVTHSQLDHAALLATRNAPRATARGNLAMFQWDATGVLSDLRVPALIIGGDKDLVTKLEASRVMAGESELADLRVVQDVNHMGPLERADLYNQLIADFALQVQPVADDRSTKTWPFDAAPGHRSISPPNMPPLL
jgi:pimeloyl-ACP methyl ester carboxylesterase